MTRATMPAAKPSRNGHHRPKLADENRALLEFIAASVGWQSPYRQFFGVTWFGGTNPNNWTTIHAIGRDDETPSATMSEETGNYRDHAGDNETLSFWDLGIKFRLWPDVKTGREIVAAFVGFPLSGSNSNPPSLSNAATPQAKPSQHKPKQPATAFRYLNQIIAQSRRPGSPPTTTYRYYNSAKECVGAVIRCELPNGKKRFVQASREIVDGKEVWFRKAMPIPRPLYKLPLVIEDSAAVVIVCEGEKDVQAANSLKLTSTTSTQGAKNAGLTDWSPLANKSLVVIWRDNDDDGLHYAKHVAAILLRLNSSLAIKLIVAPDAGLKDGAADFVAARTAAGRTIEEMRGEIDALIAAAPLVTADDVTDFKAADDQGDNEGLAGGEDTAADDSSEAGDDAPDGGGEPAPLEVNEAVDDPHRLARLYIENCASHDGVLAIRRHREDWKKWNGRDYRTVTQEELQADLCRFIKEEFDRFNVAQLEAFNARDPQADDFDKKAKPPQALKVTRFLTSNVMAALQGYCTLDSSRDAPIWTIDNPPHPANEMVSTESGLIHIPSLANGSTPWRFESTPEFFSPNSIAVKFQDDDYIQTRSPLRWFDFLDTIFPDAPDQVELLREWFGYTLLPDTSMQKMLLLVGPKRSGKGTICRILTALVGILNVVNPRLSSFATDFGLEQLIGKTVAIITDARLSGRVDISQIAEVLLSISGEDRVTIARKYKTDLSCRLPVRFMIVSNELPAIMDSSGAFASRCVLLQTGQSFLGREDRDLEAALLAELPGIFVWAAQGWQQLQERGRFEQPESSSAALDELKGISAPIQEFLREECTFDPDGFETVTDLFRRWEAWCKLRGINPSSSPVMGRNLLAASSKVKSTQPNKDGVRVRGYGGIRLINGLPT